MRTATFFFACLLGLSPLAAHAQKAGRAPAQVATVSPESIEKLQSANPANIGTALSELKALGRKGGPAAPLVAAILKKGLSEPLTESALETLGALENEAASEVCALYTRHRAVKLRRAAIQALTSIRGAVASRTIRRSLSDPNPEVRKDAATALGALRAKDAIGDLFSALDKNVFEAAKSIGLVCAGADCERLNGYVTKLPFDVVTSGLKPILLRPTAEVREATKLQIIHRLRELSTPEVARFFEDVQKNWPKDGSRLVKAELDVATRELGGGE